MATKRDVKMTLSVDTLGEDGVKSLRQSIQTLADQGGAAAPEFQKLADEVGRLGEQSKSLQTFRELADATEALRAKQVTAAQASDTLATRLTELRQASDLAKIEQKSATAAVAEGQAAVIQAGTAIRALKADYDNTGKQTSEYRAKLSELVTAQGDARVKLIELREAQRLANEEASNASAAQKQVEKSYISNERAVAGVTKALAEQETNMRDAAAAATKLGVATEDVATAEGMLIASLNKVGTEAQQHSARLIEMAESDRLLAIQEKGLAELYQRGADALQAETLAQRDAARSNAEYDASLAKLNAEKAKAVDTAAQWQKEAEAIVNAAHAAQQMERETATLVETERELVAANAFEKQAADARKLAEAADYVSFWTQELKKADAAATQVQSAFNALNIRSAEEIKAELAAVRSALEVVAAQSRQSGTTMAGAFTAGNAKIRDLELELRTLNGTLTTSDKIAGVFKTSLGQISAGNIVADGVGYLVNKVKELGAAFLEAIVQGDQMRRGLNAIYGDVRVTASQIDFLRKTSSESGVALGSLSGEFVRFSASMKSANIPIEQSNNLFRAVTSAAAALGLGAEATSGTLNALGQMASKGTVSMEELRQQLGDRLPGALGLAADGMGITTGQLIQLVSTGGLATRDFIVPFTGALEKMRGETDGLVPSWERFKGVLTQTSQAMGESGGVQLLTGALKTLGGLLGTLVLGFSVMFESVMSIAKSFGVLAASAMTLTNPLTALKEIWSSSTDRLAKQNDALNTFIDGTTAATTAATSHAAAMTANTAEITKQIASNKELSSEQKLVALSTALAADKTLDASAKIVQYNVAAAQLIASQQGQSDALVKFAKAAKEQGDTMVTLAKLTGDATIIQTASTTAAQMHADALDKVAKSQAAETTMLVAQKAELIANATQRGLTTQDIKTQVDALDVLIVKSTAESEQAKQSSIAAAAQLAERKLAIELLKDHSGQMSIFKAQMVATTATLAEYEKLALQGKKTEEDVRVVRQRLSAETALYNDALRDTATMLAATTAAKRADLALATAGQNERLAELRSAEALATSMGNEWQARQTRIKIKQVEIEMYRATTEAQLLEAEGSVAVSRAKLEELKVSEPTNVVKRIELETAIKLAQVKILEAQARGSVVTAMMRELDLLRIGTSGTTSNTTAVQQNTVERSANADAISRQADQQARLNALSEQATADYNSSGAALLRKLNAGTITADDKGAAQSNFDNAKANLTTMQQAPGGTFGADYVQSVTALYNQARRILDAASSARASGSGVGGMDTPQTAGSSSSHTVNITINGRTQTVNTASSADAANLASILKSLEQSAGTSA